MRWKLNFPLNGLRVQLVPVRRVEWHVARQHFKQHNAQRPPVLIRSMQPSQQPQEQEQEQEQEQDHR
jgi:hypothetical protein